MHQQREAILRTTRQEISRYGISAFRVEEIARILGMSKRTIYRIFPTRADLLRDSILLMGMQVKNGIGRILRNRQAEPMEMVLQLLEEYLDGLYNVEAIFLRELKQSGDYGEQYLGIRRVWYEALEKLLETCRQKGDILENTNLPLICGCLLTGLCEARVEEEPGHARQLAFSHIVLRGIATPAGIVRMEKIIPVKDYAGLEPSGFKF